MFLYSRSFYVVILLLLLGGTTRNGLQLAGVPLPGEVALIFFFVQGVGAVLMVALVYDLHRSRRL